MVPLPNGQMIFQTLQFFELDLNEHLQILSGFKNTELNVEWNIPVVQIGLVDSGNGFVFTASRKQSKRYRQE